MNKFRSISFPTILHESLRDYFSINKAGKLSFLYKFLICILWPLKLAWDNFETYRQKIYLISICGWKLGQLTNVLNYLYDSSNNSIYITQSVIEMVFDPTFTGTTINFDPTFAGITTVFEATFSDSASIIPVIIHIPSSLFNDAGKKSDLVATIEKIRILGLKYEIQEII
jgi:hypothetical protein